MNTRSETGLSGVHSETIKRSEPLPAVGVEAVVGKPSADIAEVKDLLSLSRERVEDVVSATTVHGAKATTRHTKSTRFQAEQNAGGKGLLPSVLSGESCAHRRLRTRSLPMKLFRNAIDLSRLLLSGVLF